MASFSLCHLRAYPVSWFSPCVNHTGSEPAHRASGILDAQTMDRCRMARLRDAGLASNKPRRCSLKLLTRNASAILAHDGDVLAAAAASATVQLPM